ncbi:hypothetical protein E4T56_gene13226 [Termitomyces sp. T112]|nr:hypothetical protein E4T56_gene13226 [Termitomyces sp. T112]
MNESINQAAAQAHFLKFCIQYASIALIYYDYMLTLRLEVTYMWCSKFRISTILYILTRYALVANVLYLCDSWYRTIGILSVLGRASVIVVFSARTYAVWNKSWIVLAWLGSLGITCIVLDALHVPGLRCKGSSSSQLGDTSICPCLLYFCGVFVFTASAMILNFVVDPDSFLIRLLNALTLPFSCLLTSRFLLNLRSLLASQSSQLGSGIGTQHIRSTVSSINFGVRGMVDEFAHSGDIPADGESGTREINGGPGGC